MLLPRWWQYELISLFINLSDITRNSFTSYWMGVIILETIKPFKTLKSP